MQRVRCSLKEIQCPDKWKDNHNSKTEGPVETVFQKRHTSKLRVLLLSQEKDPEVGLNNDHQVEIVEVGVKFKATPSKEALTVEVNQLLM